MTEHPVPHGDHGVRFEKTDVESRPIIRFGIVLIVVCVVIGGLLVYLFRGFADLEYESDPPPAPLAHAEPGRQPPAPRLQTQPFDDYERMRAEEDRILGRYGWVDERAGVVHIPIDEAMKQVAGKLPVKKRQ